MIPSIDTTHAPKAEKAEKAEKAQRAQKAADATPRCANQHQNGRLVTRSSEATEAHDDATDIDTEEDDMGDFIQSDESDDEEDDEYDPVRQEDETDSDDGDVTMDECEPATDESCNIDDEAANENDGIDKANILSGKRVRRPTVRYEDTVFASSAYQKMMLCDVPFDELNAALVDEDFSEDGESNDDAYNEDEEEEEYEDHHESEGDRAHKEKPASRSVGDPKVRTIHNERTGCEPPRRGETSSRQTNERGEEKLCRD